MDTLARTAVIAALLIVGFVIGFPLLLGLWQSLYGGLPYLSNVFDSAGLFKSAFTALMSSALALFSAVGLAAIFQGKQRALTWISLPLLAIPHAAIAQAISLLFGPSSFTIRLLSPWATGYTSTPNNWLWDQHPDGWTLIIVLAMKELPFFLILIYNLSSSLPLSAWQRGSTSLGYSRVTGWWHIVLPVILRRLWLPLCLVIIFCLSVVDVPALVGPNLTKTFAHQMYQNWINDTPQGEVLASGVLLLGLSIITIAISAAIFKLYYLYLRFKRHFVRGLPALILPWLGASLGLLLMGTALVSLALLPVQSVLETSGHRVPFPQIWMGKIGLNGWMEALKVGIPTLPTTLLIGALTSSISLLIALWLLVLEKSYGHQRWLETVLMIPLLVPQMAFLAGGAFLGIRLGLIPNHGILMATWFHLLFVLPYIFLIVAPTYRGIDLSFRRTATALGHNWWSIFFRVELPILFRPLVFAFAWGLAVSMALYLPTFFATSGRLETLLTAGLTQLAGKGDNIRAVWGLMLLMLPVFCFLAAYGLASWQASGRKGLRGG